MKITIGSDHRGYNLKFNIIQNFKNYAWLDVGTYNLERTDYPVIAKKVCNNILEEKSDLGILICGSGIGVSIAANRYKKIYAALCWNEQVAKSAKEDDNANVLVLPADFIENNLAFNIITVWINSRFKGGRYLHRLELIDN